MHSHSLISLLTYFLTCLGIWASPEPAVSVPRAKETRPLPTREAEPEEEAPGMNLRGSCLSTHPSQPVSLPGMDAAPARNEHHRTAWVSCQVCSRISSSSSLGSGLGSDPKLLNLGSAGLIEQQLHGCGEAAAGCAVGFSAGLCERLHAGQVLSGMCTCTNVSSNCNLQFVAAAPGVTQHTSPR